MKDNFKSVSGLSRTISYIKKNKDTFNGSISDELMGKLMLIDSNVVFSLSSLFTSGSFRPISDILTKKVDCQIDRLFFNGDDAKILKEKVQVIRELINILNDYFGDSKWIYTF